MNDATLLEHDIEEYRAEAPTDIASTIDPRMGLLNNFIRHLPGRYSYQGMVEQCFMLDDPCEYPDASPLRKEQTFRQFYTYVNAAVQKTGLDVKRLDELMPFVEAGYQDQRAEALQMSIPCYEELRSQGYSRKDLTRGL